MLLETAATIFLAVTGATATEAKAQRQMEKLGRGVVAIKQQDGKVFIGWRLLGADARNIAFNLYRATGNAAPRRLNAKPISGATNFLDSKPTPGADTKYFVRPLQNRREAQPSAAFTLKGNAPAQPYLSLPLQTPAGYTPNDASAADLDGDGEHEIVLHQVGRGKDNSQNGETDPPILQAYKLNGKLLWTINLGRNIREGAHYTQFMVYDLDGDGRAEMVCKTADGTTDGQGRVIGDAGANHVNEAGRILAGPEFLTVFDGLTGKALATTNYIPARHPATQNPTGDELKAVWGDDYGNRNDRFLACVAYLDGVRPSVVMARGYYTRTVLAAWNWRGGQLSHQWTFDSNDPGHEKYAGQGNHNLSVADVDGDGRDEIVYGKMCVDDNWASEAAQAEGVAFIDLNAIVAERYDAMGKEKVDALFGGDWTHTNAAGAEFNARSVISGLKALANHPLAAYLSPQAGAVQSHVPPTQTAPAQPAPVQPASAKTAATGAGT